MNSILKKLIQSSRMKYYEDIISLALDHGYLVTSLVDWYENDFYPGQKVFILRHDVDYDSEGAFRMFEIEKRLQVKSTFYYRWSTTSPFSMKVIHDHGFEVSLHYETLATYCREKDIKDAKSISKNDFDLCYQKLLEEKRKFEKQFWKVKTLCSHGDHRNRLIGVANHRILEGKSRDDLDIYFEIYDKEIISKFDAYMSDSSIKSDHQWRYNLSPEIAIKGGRKSICLLTHPQHWNYHLKRNIQRIATDVYEHFFRF